jgi:DnaJ-domain-containing protein 1
MEKECPNCQRTFDAKRQDNWFCSDECKAQFKRTYGDNRERYHAEHQNSYYGFCAHCSGMFFYNDYAKRGGERSPRFCSDSCRQKAWRAAKKSANSQNTASGQQGHKKAHTGTNSGSQQNSGTSAQNQAPKNGHTTPGIDWMRWYSRDPYKVLGLDRALPYDLPTIKKAYRALVKTYHPDVCKLCTQLEATEILQHINKAWDLLK